MTDAYNLQRFLDAQERVYDTVLDELRAGRKSSHWIWFIFPQVAGLGRSAEEIFPYPDNLKFRSCMTLFMAATTDHTLFKDALLTYFDGKPDQSTLDILAQQSS